MWHRPLLVGLGVLLVLAGAALVAAGFTRPPMTTIDPPAAVSAGAQMLEDGEESSRGPGWALAGGLALAAGFAAIGIGVGRWGKPRPPLGEADFTGPGEVRDHRRVPPTV